MRRENLLGRHRQRPTVAPPGTCSERSRAPITIEGEPDSAGVTDVRFVTTDSGWAFGPKLFQTSDGGASWSSVTIPGSGKQVLSLATTSTAGAYAVVSKCRYGQRPVWSSR